MSKQAPPLGNLSRPVDTEPSVKLPTPKLSTATPATQLKQGVSSNKQEAPPVMQPGQELTFNQQRDTDRLTRPSHTVANEYQPAYSTELGANRFRLQELAGDESTPFTFTGVSGGRLASPETRINPTDGIARHDSTVGTYVTDPLNQPGSADIVIANSRPVNSFQYTEGLTQSQLNSRNFFNGLQDFRQQIAPRMLPALQYTPQQLNPNVAGGFAPTAETKGPLSWLMGAPQQNVDVLNGEFGASGTGLLGGLGWLFGRLSPTTYLKGAAMDVSRSVAALVEGGNASVQALLKGDYSNALGVGVDAASENYAANSPEARGMPGRNLFSSGPDGALAGVDDWIRQSYFLSAAAGFNDTSFSGTGNNPLGGNEGVARNVVGTGESFNPFGMRDPVRSAFNTGALEAYERNKLGKSIVHGYDQFGAGALGLVGDVLLEGRIDKVVSQAFTRAASANKAIVAGVGKNPARRFTITDTSHVGIPYNKFRNNTDILPDLYTPPLPRKIPDVTPYAVSTPNARRGTNAGTKYANNTDILPANIPDAFRRQQQLLLPSGKGGALVPSTGGSIVPSPSARTVIEPIGVRYTPANTDPLRLAPSRTYVPQKGLAGVNFVAGGAIVPTTSRNVPSVPAVLGVGGAPGNIPLTSKVLKQTLRNEPPVTTYDDATGTFITRGSKTTDPVIEVLPPANTVDELTSTNARNIPERTNTPEGTVSPRTGDSSGLSSNVSSSALRTTAGADSALPKDVFPVDTGRGANRTSPTVSRTNRVENSYAPVVPKNAPNFTVTPSVASLDSSVVDTHIVDETTGVFVNAQEQASVAARKSPQVRSTASPTELAPLVDVPIPEVQYITAEAISPSVTSADIVRRLTSGDDIEGAIYNPQQVQRQQRSIQSLVSLARQVTLPGGVKVLDDSIKDVSVLKFDRLMKRVDAAIVASGLNASGPEAASIRRLFDRNGKPLPTNLAPDFSIVVAPRTLDSPTQFVKPATTVVDGTEWTGRAARYTSRYELSNDYAIGVALKYDKDLDKMVPVDGQDIKLTPPTRPGTPSISGGSTLRRSDVLDMLPSERQALVSKSYADGYDVPRGAVDDALTPNIADDVKAAEEYALRNLPKESRPVMMNREARTVLDTHEQLTGDVQYTQQLITDVSTQLTDVERTLNAYLKKVDDLDDIGVGQLTDDVPLSPLPPLMNEDIPLASVPGVLPRTMLYHGTRVQDLHISGINPLEGAARSEYGTGVWFTSNQDLALSASGRMVPDNSVPNVNRVFTDDSYIHELDVGALDHLNVVRATDALGDDVSTNLLRQLDTNRFAFSDVVPYGDDLTDELVNLLETRGSTLTYEDLFQRVDTLTRKTAKRNIGTAPDEYELTYVQRVFTDMLHGTGVQGVTNGVNTVVYDTRNVATQFVHDVTDLVGDSSDEVVTALHNVNLLQRSLDAAPTSKYLQVQLAEAKAVAASKVRDSLSHELHTLNSQLSKQSTDLMNYDDVVTELALKQRSEAITKATIKDTNTYESFKRELTQDWNGPCL